MPDTPIKAARISPSTRLILEKMTQADLISVMEEMGMGRVASVNCNIGMPAGADREEMVKAISALPTEKLSAILKEHGIL